MSLVDVSVVIPVRNGLPYLDDCLKSLLEQETLGNIVFEVCIYDDGSSDDTPEAILRWKAMFEERSIPFKTGKGEHSGGVGYAKNRAVQLSSGRFLCFCDADDISLPSRIISQYNFTLSTGKDSEMAICGSNFVRNDENSTVRYTKWANNLSGSQLLTQRFTAFGPTVVAPTWFLSRSLYDRVGGFNELQRVGYPEDLQFFFDAVKLGASVIKVPECLVMYRYHPGCATFSVHEDTIWDMRIKCLQETILSQWSQVTIWNAGKQGKKFYKSLSAENCAKVVAMCDVDSSKIRHGKYDVYDEKERKVVSSIPVISHENAVPPVIICVKLDLTNGAFEHILEQKRWREGVDYFHFDMSSEPKASTSLDGELNESGTVEESDDDYEELTMVLRLDGVLDTATVRENVRTGQCTVRRADSGHPLVQMGKSLYSAEWAQTMGTDLILKPNEQQQLQLVSISSVRMLAEKSLASAPAKDTSRESNNGAATNATADNSDQAQ